jgi:hypothetical protein
MPGFAVSSILFRFQWIIDGLLSLCSLLSSASVSLSVQLAPLRSPVSLFSALFRIRVPFCPTRSLALSRLFLAPLQSCKAGMPGMSLGVPGSPGGAAGMPGMGGGMVGTGTGIPGALGPGGAGFAAGMGSAMPGMAGMGSGMPGAMGLSGMNGFPDMPGSPGMATSPGMGSLGAGMCFPNQSLLNGIFLSSKLRLEGVQVPCASCIPTQSPFALCVVSPARPFLPICGSFFLFIHRPPR